MWLASTVCLPAESDLVEAIIGHDVSGPLVVGLDVVGPLVVGLDGPLVVTLGDPVA